jgi:oligopeptide transport system ATP-binding protein
MTPLFAPNRARDLAPDGAVLTLVDLSKRFPAAHDILGRPRSWVSAVDRVNLTVRRGSMQPSSGRILYAGTDVSRATGAASRELRRKVQIVFQDPYSSLDPRQRVASIVEEGLHYAGLDRPGRSRRVAALLEQVGLDPSTGRNLPHQLSGGQRQRVGIARALAAEPEVLVADEPVSALDGSIQGQILNLLQELRSQRGLTLVFITHDLSVARYMADEIAVMHLGQVVERSPVAQLFDRPAHPYTQALLSAVPRFGRGGPSRIVLTGDAPSPIDPPIACRFAGRCAFRTDPCTQAEPPLIAGPSVDHHVACFNWGAAVSNPVRSGEYR